MKRKLLFFLISCSLSTLLWAKEDCMQKYKDSLKQKQTRYEKASERYHNNRNSALSASFSRDFGTQVLGSIVLQNSTAPRKDDYDMFEADIIKAAEADLSNFPNLKPTVLEGIYNAAYEQYADVTYQKIQSLIIKGFLDNNFCTLLGRKRVPAITKYVLKQLKQSSQHSVVVREPAVINSKDDGEDKAYQADPKEIDQEINHPLENKGILE